MTHRLNVARGREIVSRWCALAEQRLNHLTELFETGRWRRYHSEATFLANIKEAKAAVELWRDLLTREASYGNSTMDVPWLGLAGSALPRGADMVPNLARRLPAHVEQKPADPSLFLVASPSSDVSTVLDRVVSDDAPSAPASEERAVGNAAELIDVVAMQERYPLLRNAL
jgi:uncharacterized repeat protein (TIGR03809 family)